MSSTFSGLSVGLSSLYAQRRGLELTGHNVANSNTEGYSRQRVRLSADGGPITPAMHSRWDGSGGGVTVAGTQRLRDVFLEGRAVQERGTEGSLRGQQVALGRVEGVFGEPSESGIAAQLDDFWSGWHDVAKNPTVVAARSQLLERASTLAAGLNSATDRIDAQWSSSREQLVVSVDNLNATAASIAEFNRAIQSATRGGLNPNDLTDQRDLLVQQLASAGGVSVKPGEDGAVDVTLGGRTLVTGRTSERLVVGGAASLTSPAGTVGISWESDGLAAPVGGALGGSLAELNTILPTYRDGLGKVATALRDQVNTQHKAGFDQEGFDGVDLLAVDANGRMSVLLDDPARVAASSTKGDGTGDRGGTNAAKLGELATTPGGADEVYRKLVVSLGVQAQTANRRVDIQANIVSQIDAARESDSGVNIDEEMTNMLAYQRAYEGAARFVRAVDEMLDTLINRTGR